MAAQPALIELCASAADVAERLRPASAGDGPDDRIPATSLEPKPPREAAGGGPDAAA